MNYQKFLYHINPKQEQKENVVKFKEEDFIVNEILTVDNKRLNAKYCFEKDKIIFQKGNYQLYVLYKKNSSMSKVISQIIKIFNKKESKINYCGIKDKKAITYQFLTIQNGFKKNLENKLFSLKYVGDLNEPLFVGKHDKNNFQIVIRNVNGKKNVIEEFINFFGEQRFSKNNFKIGLNIIKKDFKNACYQILQNSCKENIKEKFDLKNYDFIIENSEEKIVLEHLKKNNTDYIGAIKKIKFKFLSLYLASVQSAIFNEVCLELYNNNIHKKLLIPLFGFGTEKENYSFNVYQIVQKILNKYNLKSRDFIIRNIPNLSLEGENRYYKSVANINKFEYIDDKLLIDFDLDKGCYATVFLDQLLM